MNTTAIDSKPMSVQGLLKEGETLSFGIWQSGHRLWIARGNGDAIEQPFKSRIPDK